MRHGKKFNHLGRKRGHRRALLANMANSLIEHKRIKTTLAKARELRKYVEPLITRSKTDDTSNRRMVFRYLQNKNSIKTLFGEIAQKVGDRPGGYTRIIKLGFRRSDAAEMALIELVDYNETMQSASSSRSEGKKKTRRSRRGGGKSTAEPTTTEEVKATVANDSEEADVVADTPEADEQTTTDTTEENKPTE